MTSGHDEKTTLLLIDVQKDFHPGGSLGIPSANSDAERIAELIRNKGASLDRIVATLDTHQKLHIAHPHFWLDKEGKNHPAPFTIISSQDVEQGVWKPREDIPVDFLLQQVDPEILLKHKIPTEKIVLKSETPESSFDLYQYCLEYTRQLEKKGRFQLCIWPEHCLIGSAGHGMVDSVLEALGDWSASTGRTVEWVWKGQNLLTEMYSALAADVPVTADTDFNKDLLDSLLLQSDRLLVCGQAMSHCVNYTVRDIVAHCPPEQIHKITLLQDCASAVPGFEKAATDFQNDMTQAGVQLKNVQDLQL